MNNIKEIPEYLVLPYLRYVMDTEKQQENIIGNTSNKQIEIHAKINYTRTERGRKCSTNKTFAT